MEILVGGEIVALNDEAQTNLDEAVAIDVLANDRWLASGGVTIAIVTSPTNGTITIDTETNTVLYTPALGWSGTESFTYSITDADDNTTTAMVEVTVIDLQAIGDVVEVEMNTPTTIDVLTNDTGANLSVVAVTQASFGTVVYKLHIRRMASGVLRFVVREATMPFSHLTRNFGIATRCPQTISIRLPRRAFLRT